MKQPPELRWAKEVEVGLATMMHCSIGNPVSVITPDMRRSIRARTFRAQALILPASERKQQKIPAHTRELWADPED
jgi:hypothetical protein